MNKNYNILIIQFSNFLISFPILFIITNNFGFEKLSEFLIAMSLVNIGQTIGSYASDDYIVSKAALLKNRALYFINSIISSCFIFNFIYYLCLNLIFLYLDLELINDYKVLGLIGVFGNLNLFESYFVGEQNLQKLQKISLMKISIAILIFILLIIFQNKNILIIYLIYLIFYIILSIYYSNKIFKKKYNLKFLKKYYIKYFPIFFVSFINFFKMRGTILISQYYLNPEILGFFGLILRVIDYFTVFFNSVSKIFYPRLIKLFKLSKNYNFKKNIKITIIFLFLSIIYLIFVFKKNLHIDTENYLLFFNIFYISVLISLFKIYENLIRLFSINNNLNFLVFKTTLVASFSQIFFFIIIVNYFLFNGAIIYLVLNNFILIILYHINFKKLIKSSIIK